MMVSIASFLLCFGRPVIRSIAICLKRRAPCSMAIQYSGVLFQCVIILFCWHIAHPLT
jgi:hypothetical protein